QTHLTHPDLHSLPTRRSSDLFINNPEQPNWQDIPASYHNGACGFSFADGHSEIKKWRSAASKFPVRFAYPSTPTFTVANNGMNRSEEHTSELQSRENLVCRLL